MAMRNPLKIFRRAGIFSAFLLLGAFFAPLRVFAWGFTDAVGNTVLAGISLFILTFASTLLGIFGTFFNWVVIRTVFQFGVYFGTTDGMLLAWGVMRDIANIGLLFGFIFMGVMLILNVSGGHGGGMDAKRAIPRLILFAVLLNFSLFASQGIIDVANALGSQFAGLAGLECTEDLTGKECANRGISGRVMQMAGITSVWNAGLLTDQSGVTLLALALFVSITAMVLLAAAIMLIVRVVILTLLMVTSPIGFAGMVIPGLGGLAKQWWHALISQAFFAPVMLLLMFISLKLADSMNENGSSIVQALGGLGTDIEGNIGGAGDLEILVVFAVVIGLMLASLMAASKMGAMGAKFATNSAAALTFGTMTRGTNALVGGGMYAARLGMQKGGTKVLGRVAGGVGMRLGGVAGARRGLALGRGAGEVLTNRVLRPGQEANLDVRRIPGMGQLLGAAGVDAGGKAAEHASFTDMKHQYEEFRDGKEGKALHQQYENETKTLSLEDAAHHNSLSDKDKQFLASLSLKELEKLHGIKDGLEGLAINLSSDQFEKLMGSENLTEAEKGTLKASRFKSLKEAAAAGDVDSVKALVKNMTKKDLENLPASLLARGIILENISDKQREELLKGDKRSTSEKDQIRASYRHEVIKKLYETEVAAGRDGAAAVLASGLMSNMTMKQFVEIDPKILVEPSIAITLEPQMLGGLLKENKLKRDEIRTIGGHINAEIAAGRGTEGQRRLMAGPAGAAWV